MSPPPPPSPSPSPSRSPSPPPPPPPNPAHLNVLGVHEISEAHGARARLLGRVRVHPDDPGAARLLQLTSQREVALAQGGRSAHLGVLGCTLRPMTTERPTPPKPKTAAEEPGSTCRGQE
jgi:hypothetical protein